MNNHKIYKHNSAQWKKVIGESVKMPLIGYTVLSTPDWNLVTHKNKTTTHVEGWKLSIILWAAMLTLSFCKLKKKIIYWFLVINYFYQSCLVVAGSLKSMKIHHSCSNVGKSTSWNIVAESDTRGQSRTSNSNWHLNQEGKVWFRTKLRLMSNNDYAK